MFQLTSTPFHVPFTNNHPPMLSGIPSGNNVNFSEIIPLDGMKKEFSFNDTDSGKAGDFGDFTVRPPLPPGLNMSYNNVSGSLLLEALTLDYETRPRYHFTIKISDNAPPPFQKFTRYELFH